jgi:membrane protein YdbS with pleckstrin-like domain
MDEKSILTLKIDRDAASRYFFWSNFLLHLFLSVCFIGFWLPVLFLWMLGLGQWYSHKRADTFEAELTNKRIKIADGVFVRRIKSIPLDRVTDIVQNQGILERWIGIWSLHIQTAGAGSSRAEGVVFAAQKPEAMREAVMSTRNDYVEKRSDSPGH